MMPVVISNTAPGQYSKWGFNFSTRGGRGALNERGSNREWGFNRASTVRVMRTIDVFLADKRNFLSSAAPTGMQTSTCSRGENQPDRRHSLLLYNDVSMSDGRGSHSAFALSQSMLESSPS